jgi:subtilisin family serine protease
MAQGVDVISMSLGGGMEFKSLIESNGSESKIIRDAVDAGIIVIVAAGNENCPLGGKCEQKSLLVLSQTIEEYTVLPCAYNGTICIGASDPDTTLASYSNYPSSSENRGVDPKITSKDNKRQSQDISAPGTAIYSTYLNNSYQLLSGTSMATPFIAGLAALYKLKMPTEKQSAQGTPQRSFRKLLLDSELKLSQETSETRSFIGQVGLNYFFENLKATYEDSDPADSSEQEPLEKVERPKEENTNETEAPNILSQICGA